MTVWQRESYYRDMLAEQVQGRTEVLLSFGRADVMTSTHVYEVEPVLRWRKGAGQALQYSGQVPQRGALALYGNPAGLIEIYTEIAGLPEPGLELWWLAEGGFVHIQSYEQAYSCIPEPAPEPEPEPLPERKPVGAPTGRAVDDLAELTKGARIVRTALERKRQRYNNLGKEIWYSDHLDDGSRRPELEGLDMEERVKTIVDHWPDLTQEQLTKLVLLLNPGS